VDIEFKKVSETERVYYFPNGEKIILGEIESIGISKSGTHRINLRDGRKCIIPSGWLYITFLGHWSF